MHIPEPVISLAVIPTDNKAQINMSKALNRFTKEDPTFKTFVDHETGETIISGMGELHLEVYIERMKREYGALVEVGAPQVAYRETISQRADFNYTHKKQTGGSGQYGRVAGFMEPMEEGEYEFVDKIVGGVIPREYISSCDKGFQKILEKGSLCGAPITGVRCVINDGALPCGRLLGYCFSAGFHRCLQRRISQGKTDDHGTDNESCRRGTFRVSGFGHGFDQSAAGDDHRYHRGRQLLGC